MTSRSLCLFAVALAASPFAAASPLLAQQSSNAPAPASNPPAQRRQMPAPTNLKVLPKDMTGPQVIAIMRKFEGDLGVGCSYCHARNPSTNRPDFASDANPIKDRARVMIKMANAINSEYLTQLTEPKAESQVTCGTCHRGMPIPPAFVPEEHHQAPQPAPGGEAPQTH